MKKKHTYNQISCLFLVSIIFFILLGILRNQFKNTIWEDRGRFNLALNTNPIIIASLNPYNNQITLLTLPENIYFPINSNYGKYQLGKIWKLSLLEDNNGELFMQALQNLTGIYIQGYIGLKNKPILDLDGKNYKEQIQNIFIEKKNIWSFLNFSFSKFNPELITNLSYFDFFKMFRYLLTSKQDNLIILNSAEAPVFIKNKLPDRSIVLQLDNNAFDNYLKDNFYDYLITKENYSVIVKNTTNIIGLASKYMRLFNSLGLHVIGVENIKKPIEKNLCLVRKEAEKSYSLKKIKKITSCLVVINDQLKADIEVLISQN